ncbi:Replication factor C, subunit RFC2, partial [Trachipleistophora hominis]
VVKGAPMHENLLTEKYRPRKIGDVVGNHETIESIQSILNANSMPHLLFSGPPGTGKITVAKIIAEKIVNDKKYILELNASDERGIDTVRTTIKNFSMRLSTGLKVIILDECDSMTVAAQQAMRRTMETSTADCRFILVCNNIQKISEPIQSRCAIFTFNKIKNEDMKTRLNEIISDENLNMSDEALNTILFLSDSDMRQAINILQSTLYSKEVNENVILKITGQPSPKLIESIIILLLKNKVEEALSKFDCIWSDGYDPQDLLVSFFRVAKNMDNYEILKCISKYQLRLFEGVGSKLQFYSLLRDISLI